MARTFEEAKRYLEVEALAKAREMYPGRRAKVMFVSQLGKFIDVYWDKKKEWGGETTYAMNITSHNNPNIVMLFDGNLVRANIHNIENPYFLDLIVHELSHTAEGEVKQRYREGHGGMGYPREGHSIPAFRETYKKFSGNTNLIGPYSREGEESYDLYYGGKRWGHVPEDINMWKFKMCRNCGNIALYKEEDRKCIACDKRGDLIFLKKAEPREVIDYHTIREKHGAITSRQAQEYLKKRYKLYSKNIPISKYHMSRRKKKRTVKKKTILDFAINLSGVRRIKF